MIGLESFGWPIAYMAELRQSSDWAWAEQEGFPTSYFDPGHLALNTLVWLTIVAATGFVVERWIRRTQRGDTLQPVWSFAIIVPTIATAWILNRDSLFNPASFASYAYFSLFMGIGSTIYSAVVAVVSGTRLLTRTLRTGGWGWQ